MVSSGSRWISNCEDQTATNRAARPPTTPSSRLSSSNWRTTARRLAPSAMRTAISRRRAAPFAMSSPATLAQVMTSTRPTMPIRRSSGSPQVAACWLIPCAAGRSETCWRRYRSRKRWVGFLVDWSSVSRRRRYVTCKAASVCSRDIRGLKRAKMFSHMMSRSTRPFQPGVSSRFMAMGTKTSTF